VGGPGRCSWWEEEGRGLTGLLGGREAGARASWVGLGRRDDNLCQEWCAILLDPNPAPETLTILAHLHKYSSRCRFEADAEYMETAIGVSLVVMPLSPCFWLQA